MIRNATYSLLFLATLLVVGCDFDKKERAQNLDGKIGAINDTLLQYGHEWGEELEVAVNTLDFSHLEGVRVELEKYINDKIVYVKSLENVGGSEALLKAQLEFLAIERDIISNRFSAFEHFDTTSTMDQLSEAYANMQRSAENEQNQLEKLHKLREAYAEKNDFPKYIDKY